MITIFRTVFARNRKLYIWNLLFFKVFEHTVVFQSKIYFRIYLCWSKNWYAFVYVYQIFHLVYPPTFFNGFSLDYKSRESSIYNSFNFTVLFYCTTTWVLQSWFKILSQSLRFFIQRPVATVFRPRARFNFSSLLPFTNKYAWSCQLWTNKFT